MGFIISTNDDSIKKVSLDSFDRNVDVYVDDNIVFSLIIDEDNDNKHTAIVYKGSLKEEGITLVVSSD